MPQIGYQECSGCGLMFAEATETMEGHACEPSSRHTLISISTESYIVARACLGHEVGDVVSTEYAMISVDGREPRKYAVTLHEGCEGEGYKFYTMDEWSDTGRCTGCDLYEYNGIGD